MGEAMLSAVLDKNLSTPQEITVSDIDDVRRRYLEHRYGVAVTNDNQLAIEEAAVVVLAVKPQDLKEVMTELIGKVKPVQLVLSIVAGVRINTLSRELKHGSIVRVMPNTPARIGEGTSVWTATAEAAKQQKEMAASILCAMGRDIYVDDERYIDMATAVSGSGPAYIFLTMESLVEAAVSIGLAPDVAQELVLQTIIGSAHYVQKSGRAPSELRKMVTSPGGTTAAALRRLEEGGFPDLLKQAVTAAFERAKELGG